MNDGGDEAARLADHLPLLDGVALLDDGHRRGADVLRQVDDQFGGGRKPRDGPIFGRFLAVVRVDSASERMASIWSWRN